MHDLESESIEIIREAAQAALNPVMLYSIGKDSSVMAHLAKKAFYPGKPPFPLLHIDTGWKFKAMYQHRDKMVEEFQMRLIIYKNPEGEAEGISPFVHGSRYHTDVMKTQALKKALDLYGFDMAFGGARRDEEKSRSKERIFSFRAKGHIWDPTAQRPEMWNLYNAHLNPGESMRVFPLSNWTELDIWEYIRAENISVVPLYFAEPRPVVQRQGQWIMIDDDRMQLLPDEKVEIKTVRFRTLGCWPLSAAIESSSKTLEDLIDELKMTRFSERQGRLIDSDQPGSMEQKKKEGYF